MSDNSQNNQKWYQKGWGIGLIVFLSVTVALGVTGALDEDVVTPDTTIAAQEPTTTEAPATTVPPTTTTVPPTTTTEPEPEYPVGSLAESNFDEATWIIMADIMTSDFDTGAILCESFDYLYIDEMATEFAFGFNETAIIPMNHYDAVVYMGMNFVYYCPYNMGDFWNEVANIYTFEEGALIEDLWFGVATAIENDGMADA